MGFTLDWGAWWATHTASSDLPCRLHPRPLPRPVLGAEAMRTGWTRRSAPWDRYSPRKSPLVTASLPHRKSAYRIWPVTTKTSTTRLWKVLYLYLPTSDNGSTLSEVAVLDSCRLRIIYRHPHAAVLLFVTPSPHMFSDTILLRTCTSAPHITPHTTQESHYDRSTS